MKIRLTLTQMFCALVFGGLLLIGSCSKEKSGTGSTNEEQERASMISSESDVEAELIFNGIFDDAMGANDDVGMAGTGIFGRPAEERPNGCYTVTLTHLVNTSVFPVQIVIDFGNAGCTGTDGHVRSGKIITEYTGRLLVPGSVATTTFEDFHIDDIKIEGTLKIANSGTANERQFTVDVIDAKLSRANGNYTEWNSHKTITQIEGIITPNLPFDDIFKIEGQASGKVQRGNLLVAWETSVDEPLIKKFTCRWIVSGKVKQMRVNSNANSPWTAVLDFGSGECDNKAVVTINGVAHNITLH